VRVVRPAPASSSEPHAAQLLDATAVPAEGAEPPGFDFGTDEGYPGGDGDVPGAPPGDGKGTGSGDSNTPLVPGGDVHPPALVLRIDPEYPAVARQARAQGVVVLEAIIGTGGEIESLRVLQPLFPPLDEAAKRAVAQWRYRAATLHGRAVRVLLRVTVDFRLH